ncbi:MAG: acyl-CoA thioesterase II [Acidimicrobiales bacterium]
MTAAQSELMELLSVETLDLDLFRGHSPDFPTSTRVFGGQVAAQALMAASRTVEGRTVHSLHAYFLRAGNPRNPIIYSVQRTRDGRSYSARRVEAIQAGDVIFNLTASFHDHVEEEQLEHQDELQAAAPEPKTVARFSERRVEWGIDSVPPAQMRFIDLRPIEFVDPLNPKPMAPERRVWLRSVDKLADDAMVHAVVLAYASDLYLLGTTLLPHGIPSSSNDVSFASLDHSMWFHRPFRADDWLLYVQRTPSASRGRGLAIGSIYTPTGALAVTVAQEGVVRLRRSSP